MGSFLAKLKYSDDCLGSLLPDYGHKQHREKQGLAVWIEGEGALACKEWLRGPGRAPLSGEIKEEVRYLGPHIAMSQASSQELARRHQPARAAFYSMGGF
eukprot:2500893-Pyramimonas_sp.AAC.1